MSTEYATLNGQSDRNSSSGATFDFDGWFMLLLGALSVGLLGAVVGSFAIDVEATSMAMLATTGYLLGYLLARTLIPDILSHGLAFLAGIVISLVAIDPSTLWDQLSAGEWRLVLDRYESLTRGFLSSIRSGDRFETDIAVFAIGLTIWLVGYTAAWMLFRRGWIFWTLALPGTILLVTLALERDRPTWPALVYLGLSLALAAAFTARTRSTLWRQRGIEQPATFARRSILLGAVIAALAVGVARNDTYDLDDRMREQAFDQGDRLASWVSGIVDPSSSTPTGPQPTVGNYGAFSDQFKVGDGVPTGDAPIAVMQANGEEYLAARRLNEYDGSGWKSTSSETAVEAATGPPRIAFQSDQAMNLSPDQLQNRVQDQASIVLLQPVDELLFTIDQHFSATVPTLVRVGWDPVDVTYVIGETDIAMVPADLRELIVLLQSTEFTAPGESDSPEAVAPAQQFEVEQIQLRLREDYPVESTLSWTGSGGIQVKLEGRVPVYSDVEAVFSNDDLSGQAYGVTGLVSTVSGVELANSDSNYPQYILDTYLQLPDTVTPQTRELAISIARDAGATNPYDQAIALQEFLRTNFIYQLDAGPAPDGRDIVDYFLFESRVGRCDHFASSMSVMLRMLGVPTRIVTGLAPVPYDAEMNGFVYRGRNAHAWVEVYFTDYGWIPFEPTPTQETIDLGQTPEQMIPTPEPTPSVVPTEVPAGTQTASTPTPTALPAPAAVDTEGNQSNGDGFSPLILGLGMAGTAALAGAALFIWRGHRRYAGLAAPSANYGKLQRLGRFVGVHPLPELTPREYASQFGSARPKSATGAMLVADAYTREQYAGSVDTGTIERESNDGWREAKAGAADWKLWRRR